MTMLKTADLLNGINVGDYGEFLNDYRDCDSYICDAISEIADANMSIYHVDIMNFLSENPERVEDAINLIGWDGCGSTLEGASQTAENICIQSDIEGHLADSVYCTAINFVLYDLQMDEITEELADMIREWADDSSTNDRMSCICDKIREYLDIE